MNLLGAALYDPAVAVSKATSALLAMTAVDTTNLRIAITVPAHGIVRFRLRCAITGATTSPTILLGVLNGATVIGRVAPTYENATANAVTQNFLCDAEFTVTGLTPGAMNVDAAYAVQVVVAATNIKYGGPNTNAGANAWGAFIFEVWDPRPMPTAAPGAAGGLFIAGTNAATAITTGLTTTFTGNLTGSVASVTGAVGSVTAGVTLAASAVQAIWDALTSALTTVGSIGKLLVTNLDALISSRMATYTQPAGFLAATFPATVASPTNITAGVITTVTNVTNAPTAGDLTAAMKASVTIAATAATPIVASISGSVGSVTGNVGGNVVGSVASVTAAVTLPTIPASWISAAGIAAGALNGKGDWLLSSSYTAPLTAASTRAALGMGSANLDSQLVQIDNDILANGVVVAAVKLKTDSLTFTIPGKIDAGLYYVNGIAISGAGTAGSPWKQ